MMNYRFRNIKESFDTNFFLEFIDCLSKDLGLPEHEILLRLSLLSAEIIKSYMQDQLGKITDKDLMLDIAKLLDNKAGFCFIEKFNIN